MKNATTKERIFYVSIVLVCLTQPIYAHPDFYSPTPVIKVAAIFICLSVTSLLSGWLKKRFFSSKKRSGIETTKENSIKPFKEVNFVEKKRGLFFLVNVVEVFLFGFIVISVFTINPVDTVPGILLDVFLILAIYFFLLQIPLLNLFFIFDKNGDERVPLSTQSVIQCYWLEIATPIALVPGFLLYTITALMLSFIISFISLL